jgi:hypothetical protein
VVLLCLFIVGAVAVYVVGSKHAVNTQLEATLTGDQGTTRVRLKTETNPVSPGCGCMEPAFGTLAWYGMAVPSDGFELSVDPPKRASTRWALEGIAPGQDVVDWLGAPDHSLEMEVVGYVEEQRVRLFKGRVAYFLLLADHAVRVSQPEKNPYAALLPAAEGETTFKSRDASRSGCCGRLDVSSTAPASPALTGLLQTGGEAGASNKSHLPAPPEHTEEEGEFEPAPPPPRFRQRGPMIDVLGPKLTFEFEGEHRHPTVWAGLQQIPVPQNAENVEVKVTTPYALRLIPHPARPRWLSELPNHYQELRKFAARNHESEALKHLALGPRAQGRFIETEALPAYKVSMSAVDVPSEQRWHRFEARSSANDSTKPFLSVSKWEQAYTAVYGFPPVSKLPEVGIFGPITEFSSNAVRGTVLSSGKVAPVALGQHLELRSHEGMEAGKYRFTPLISGGLAGEQASISGPAAAILDGKPMTRAWWLPWLLGVLTAAVVSLAVEGLVAWIRRAKS